MPILIITSLMFLTFIFFPNCSNRIFYESDIALGLIALLLACKLRKIHWSVALMFFISASSVLLLMNYQQIYQHNLPEGYHLRLAATTVATYITLLSFGMLPFLLKEEHFRDILKLLFAAAFVDSLWMLIRAVIWGPDQCYAMLSNSAIDASFIACLLPFAFQKVKERPELRRVGSIFIFIMVTAIVASKSSTGLAGIGVAVASFLFMEYGIKSLKIIFPIGAAMVTASHFYLKDELLNSNGRYSIWKMAFNFFWNETHHLIGAGIGTFFMWGPEIQMHEVGADKNSLFVWMHNDWLQVLFEMGFIGLAGLIILYSCLLFYSWKKKNALFPMICTYGFIGLTQMPLRAFPLQVLGSVLIALSFDF
jgi:hypothetical protein